MIIDAAPYAPGAVGVPPHFTAISISAAAVSLTLALLLKWRPLKRLEFAIPWLCLIAGIGLAAAFLRGWMQGLGRMSRDAIPYLGVAIPVVIAVVLLFIVLYDMWPHHPTNTLTAVAAVGLPAVGPEIGGAIGGALATSLGWISVAGARIIATLVGV